MKIKIAEYNVEWMNRLFDDGVPINVDIPDDRAESRLTKEEAATLKSKRLAAVLKYIDADIIAIVEGPDTLKSGTKTASGQIEDWISVFMPGVRNYEAKHGFPSPGRQELAVIYDRDKFVVEHTPEGRNAFNEKFLVDTLEQDIHEQYSHFRPPLEVTVKDKVNNSTKLFKMIVAHAKSKGIFDQVDYARYEHLSDLNRRKLYAECMHIRERVDEWITRGDHVIVTGDINDGMGSDFYEGRFGRSAIELLMGSVYHPELILKFGIRNWDFHIRDHIIALH